MSEKSCHSPATQNSLAPAFFPRPALPAHGYSPVVVHHLVFHSAPTLLSPPRCDDSSFWISFYPLISLLSLSCAFSSYAWRISTKKNQKLQQTLKRNPVFPAITSPPLYQSFNSRLSLYAVFWMPELLLQKQRSHSLNPNCHSVWSPKKPLLPTQMTMP